MKSSELTGEAPISIWFRNKSWPAGTHFPLQALPWGKLMYSMKGLVEIKIENNIYLSTPEYAIWLPVNTEHESVAKSAINYVILHVSPSLCQSLPSKPQTLRLNKVAKAVLADFSERHIGYPQTSQDQTLVTALLEQLALSERFDSYLPLGSDDVIKIMTEKMSAAPHHLNTLAQWSGMLGLSERTLSRRFLAATGISFNEWKLRSKTLTAMTLLQEGRAVKYVASTLGYNDPSAFIAMFRRQTGQSPSGFLAVSHGSPKTGSGIMHGE
ncbi:AraC family transcriptional regulator [Serratia ureilytica]|uniref:AraC family transcriptional regulator n=1 Tax=Serratia ureilytica TaxID=300181 RepID=UPI00186691EE|nr:helix-turn-helix transcriptional regulator [Serratia ureilytica]